MLSHSSCVAVRIPNEQKKIWFEAKAKCAVHRVPIYKVILALLNEYVHGDKPLELTKQTDAITK
jgi:hypothetical protein